MVGELDLEPVILSKAADARARVSGAHASLEPAGLNQPGRHGDAAAVVAVSPQSLRDVLGETVDAAQRRELAAAVDEPPVIENPSG